MELQFRKEIDIRGYPINTFHATDFVHWKCPSEHQAWSFKWIIGQSTLVTKTVLYNNSLINWNDQI